MECIRRSASFTKLILAGFVLVAIALLLGHPQQALAKSYSMNKTVIAAALDADGTLDVVEERTFSFVGNYTYVYWDIETPADGATIINSVKATDVGGNVTTLTKSTDATAIDEPSARVPNTYLVLNYTNWSRVYVFFNLADVDQTITLDYTLTNAANAYSDVGELYWKYVAAGWAAPSKSVTLNLTLPIPAGETAIEEENVYAWDHGQRKGEVVINEDGTVTIKNSRVPGSTYAEVRVMFPVSWLTGMTPGSDLRKSNIITEETTWAEETEIREITDQIRYYGLGALYAFLSIAALVFCLVMFFRHGKEYKAKFTDKYLRAMPGDYHPALLGFVWNHNQMSDELFTATLMRLSQMKAIELKKVKREVQDTAGLPIQMDDCLIIIDNSKAVDIVDPIDMNAYLFLEKIAGDSYTLYFSDIAPWSTAHADDYDAIVEDWGTEVKSYAKQQGFIERGGTAWMVGYLVIAAILMLLGMGYFLQNALTLPNAGTAAPVIVGVLSAIVIAVTAFQMKWRSPETAEVRARCEALHNWLRDFSLLDEELPSDVNLWNDFLTMAVMFGEARRVVFQLQQLAPALIEQTELAAAMDWCLPYGPQGTPAEVMTSTFSVVEQSIKG